MDDTAPETNSKGATKRLDNRLLARKSRRDRQLDRHLRATANLTLHSNATTMRRDDLFRRGQTEARTVRLRRIECFKHLRKRLIVHTDAGVDQVNSHRPARRR